MKNKVKIPFQDFKANYSELKGELDAAYRRFMESGWFVLGKETEAFEEEYADYCESEYCVGVSNGLDALRLALLALGVKSGDEVIVPSNTYIATWLAVSHVGARPVPVEPEPSTFNIDADKVESAITSKTKVILAVNLYGLPCDYDSLLKLAHHYGIKVVIDNAQAHGARYKGRRVGGIADVECHSFYPSKNLGAFGEAGAITTCDSSIVDNIRVLRNYGSRVRYHNEILGYNNRIDELQAAFLRVKLRRLDDWNSRRAKVVAEYFSGLAPLTTKGSFSPELILPEVPEWAEPVWHLYVIRHPERDKLQKHLLNHGIQTLIHYPVPPHRSRAYAGLEHGLPNQLSLPIAERLADEVISLPVGPQMSLNHAQDVCDAICAYSR